MLTRQTKLKLTAKGYVVQKGNRDASNKYYLGYDLTKAEHRKFVIDRLYSVEVEEPKRTNSGTGKVLWVKPIKKVDVRVEYSKQIAKYGLIVEIHRPPADHYCPYLDMLQKLNLVSIEKTDQGRQIVAKSKLHGVIDAYEKNRLAEYVGKEVGKKRVAGQIKEIKKSIKDVFISAMTHQFNQEFITTYRKRKKTARGTICARSWAANQITEYKNMLIWIERNYPLEYPKQNHQFITLVNRHESDTKGNEIQERCYDVAELKQIFKVANRETKLIIALGLNTCAGAAELGRYRVSDFHFDQKHKFAKSMRYDVRGDYLLSTRLKTFNHISHRLWPWVAELVKEQVAICKANKWEFLFTNEDGQPLYRDFEMYQELGLPEVKTSKPESRFVGKWQNAQATAKIENKLPLGSLRKTLSNYFATELGDEALASLALAHSVSEDKMLKHYANKPFKKLFEQTISAESFWNLTTSHSN